MSVSGAMSRAQAAAPLITFVLLVALILLPGSLVAETTPGSGRYFERVKAEVEEIPYVIGDWLGRDVAPQEAAGRLLRPNAIMQRVYRNGVTGDRLTLLVVHCSDARDMEGHYPPVCYPSSGWTSVSGWPQEATAEIGAVAAPARVYRFSKATEGLTQTNEVLNFFVLPREHTQIAADMEAVERATRSRRLTKMGAAQIQILTPASMGEEEREEAVATFLRALEPLIWTISEGVREGDTNV